VAAKKSTAGYRTDKGTVTAKARRETGIGDTEKFPVFDTDSGDNALDKRNSSNDIAPHQVVNHVAAFADETNDAKLKKRVADVRKEDAAKKK
jgi:hypothetical protein